MQTGGFLTAEWRRLAMLNYEIDPAALRPFIPRGVELDTWNNRHFVSVVGFLFLKTRVLGLPIPFHRDFEEINLRFYVRRRAEYGWRDGGSWHHVRAKTAGEAQPLVEGSEEEFITEHYWGYAAQRDGGCVEYQVVHPRWSVWRTSGAAFECDVNRVYGDRFVECLGAKPASAFVADGSAVAVRKGARI